MNIMKRIRIPNKRRSGQKMNRLCQVRNLLCMGLCIFMAMAVFASFAMGEDTQPELPAEAKPIPLEEVGAQAIQVSNLLVSLQTKFPSNNDVDDIQKNLPSAIDSMAAQKKQTLQVLQSELNLVTLQDEGAVWHKNQDRMAKWQSLITQRATILQSMLAQLVDMQKIWSQTLVSAKAANAQEEVIQQIGATLSSIGDLQTPLQTRYSDLISLQNRVDEALFQCGDLLDQIFKTQRNMVKGIGSHERIPIWTPELWAKARANGYERLLTIFENRRADVELYLFDPSSRMPIHAGFFIFLLTLFFMMRRHAGHLPEEEHLSVITHIVHRPFAAAFIITMLLASSPYLPLPKTIQNLFEALVLVAMIRLAKPMVAAWMISGLYALCLLYTLDMVRLTFVGAVLLEQSLLLLEALAGMTILGWSLIYGILKTPFARADSLTRFHTLRKGAIITLVLLGVGFLAGTLGYLILARLLVSTVFSAGAFALAAFIFIKIFFGLAAFSLRVRPLRLLRMVNRHRDLLERRIYKMMVWLAIIGFSARVLKHVGLLQPVVMIGNAILDAKLERGAISISLEDILAFGLCVWASYLLSSFINFVLEEDVYPRSKVPHGIAYAASRIIRYLIIAIGFVLGIGLLGIDLTKVTVLIGALGVGIGFGLQSVVNNFVSGLILLFEQPIHARDIVEVGNIQGTVKRIGIRASILQTRQGAEIIIPNSQLVSEQVTNWTFSDQRRRIDLPVGVSYSANPQKVIKVLSTAAGGNSRILKNPRPQVLLMEFGDSAIKYELRAWTDQFNDWPEIRSELTIAVYDAIQAAGMSIPYPQREVRLIEEKGA